MLPMERKPDATHKPTFGAGCDGGPRARRCTLPARYAEVLARPATASSLDDAVVPSTRFTPRVNGRQHARKQPSFFARFNDPSVQDAAARGSLRERSRC